MIRHPQILIPTRHDTRRGKSMQFVGGLHLDLLLKHQVAPIPLPAIDGMDEHVLALLDTADGLLLTEGGDLGPELRPPSRHESGEREELDGAKDRVEAIALRGALERDMPVLGICRGMQLINALLGGELFDDIPTQVGNEVRHLSPDNYHRHRHPIALTPGSPLYATYETDTLPVSSYHHQGISSLAPGLVAIATAPDGIVEAFYAPERSFVWGLQFHPERQLDDDPRHGLIHAQFAAAAHAYAEARP